MRARQSPLRPPFRWLRSRGAHGLVLGQRHNNRDPGDGRRRHHRPDLCALVRIQLRPHRFYLQSRHYLDSGYLEQYTQKFQAFLHAMLSGGPKRDA